MWAITLFCLVLVSKAMSREIPIDRIVEGQEALPSQFPHQVALTYNNRLFCGGSIISETKILTAAHCVSDRIIDNPSIITVYAGSIYRTNGTVVPISKVARLARANIYYPDKDIAVLTTKNSIVFTDSIKPISLPPQGRAVTGNVTVSGWGRTVDGSPTLPVELRYVNLTVIDNSTCKRRYGSGFTENMWCAGNFRQGGPGACQGDSGGPAVQSGILVGIVSWGGTCGGYMDPTVFTNVASTAIRNYITENTGL